MCKECEAKEKKGEKRGVSTEPERSWGRGDPAWEVPLQSDWVIVPELRGWGQGR